MASVFPSEGSPTQALALCGPRRRHSERCPRAQWPDIEGCVPVVRRDAPRGGNVAQGQVHPLRQEGEELPQEHSQYVLIPALPAQHHKSPELLANNNPPHRAAQVDSCQPTCQPPRILNGFPHPFYMYYTSDIRLWPGTCRSENNIWTTGVLAFWTCSEATLRKMVAYNVPLLPQRLDQAFNSNAFDKKFSFSSIRLPRALKSNTNIHKPTDLQRAYEMA